MIEGRYAFTVTGVIKDVPENSHLHFDCIIPIVNFWEWWEGREGDWGMIMFYTYLQLQPNSSPSSVGQKIAAVLNENVPEQKAGIRMQPLMDVHLRSNFGWDLDNFEQGSQSTLTIFSHAALAVLLLAMINFINLSTARSASRAKEVGLRKINGARRSEIIVQFLGESVVISFLALLIGTYTCLLCIASFQYPCRQAYSIWQPIRTKALFNAYSCYFYNRYSVGKLPIILSVIISACQGP